MRLGDETQAVLLLTARLGAQDPKDAKPLGPTEWGDFAEWLKHRGCRPGELVNGQAASLLAEWRHPKIPRERLDKLLQRGNALALALEKWERAGIWILTRADKQYPTLLKKRLGKSAPPVFFGCGNRALLQNGGLAVVGSRKAGEADLAFCRQIGAKAAAEGYSIVSGGARGVDETAMLAALDHEGTVIGVLADSLMRAVTSQRYRGGLRSGDLVLVSPYQPEARFLVDNAMGRNKYIYCLANAGLIVTCEKESGGTYAGAKEALKHAWVPVWTHRTASAAEGMAALEALGAARLPGSEFRIESLFEQKPLAPEVAPTDSPEESAASAPEQVHVESEEPVLYAASPKEEPEAPAEALFQAFLQKLQPMIQSEPLKPDEIAERFEIKPAQARDWLQQAEDAGLVDRVSKKPLAYSWVSQGRLTLGD
ncbi:MAG: DNA-protecting protein DprA [Pseudomonadota bacterium]|nr:MAG: DNA-protecting protein DprA [Pseudomonadota bacterium]